MVLRHFVKLSDGFTCYAILAELTQDATHDLALSTLTSEPTNCKQPTTNRNSHCGSYKGLKSLIRPSRAFFSSTYIFATALPCNKQRACTFPWANHKNIRTRGTERRQKIYEQLKGSMSHSLARACLAEGLYGLHPRAIAPANW
jgi:hypothetical protein